MSAPTTTADAPAVTRTLLPERIEGSYTTRFVHAAVEADRDRFRLVSGAGVEPKAGDVVVARVTRIGNHRRIETPVSRKAILFQDAVVMLAYGNRYAADQFLAHVPADLSPCHLVAAGGIAGVVTESHSRTSTPTAIEPLGLLADEAGVVTLDRFAPLSVDRGPARTARPEVIGVLGTSMNSGKSTAMAHLIHGLTRSGRRVAAGKITGTGAGNDPMIYNDAGAARVIDFTDFGHGTTFRMPMSGVRALTVAMVDELADGGADVIVVEIADGVYQDETSQLLRDDAFHGAVDHVVFAAVDALGARAGVAALEEAGVPVSAVTGVLTSSPLATAEAGAVLSGYGVPVVGTHDLSDPAAATALLRR
ncbi:DUF1611 domain-containing protein [Corynebacterium sp. 335C]